MCAESLSNICVMSLIRMYIKELKYACLKITKIVNTTVGVVLIQILLTLNLCKTNTLIYFQKLFLNNYSFT